jgi:hypothetical protein
MTTLRTTTNKRVSMRLKAALVTLAFFGLLLGTVAVAPLRANAQGSRYLLTVRNQSRFQIDRLYLSASDEDNWGPDQLGRRVISAYSDFSLTNIRPGEYDIKIVDHDGDGCVIRRVSFFESRSWTITNANLLRCEGYH